MASFQTYILRRRVTNTPAGDLTFDIKQLISAGRWTGDVTSLGLLLSRISATDASVQRAARVLWRGYQLYVSSRSGDKW